MVRPLVTVVIPVYNREATILRAINSVLRQTYTNIEIIIVDDCSTDATVKVVNGCNDRRIHMICLPCNQGANFARNKGIEAASGEFIAFQDSDDEWLEDKLDKQITYMLCENLEASFCPYILHVGDQVQIVPNDYQNIDLYTAGLKEKLKRGNVVGTPTLIVKRNIFSQIGMFDEEMNRLQDYEFVIRFVKKHKLGYWAEPLVNAYRIDNSISTNEKAFLSAYETLLEKHSDFLDMKCVISSIFNYTTVFESGKIDWEKINGLIEKSKGNSPEKNVDFCKLITEYIYKKLYSISKIVEDWYSFFAEYVKTEEFAIYGAGVYGRKVYNDMKKRDCVPLCFYVSRQNGQLEIDGIPIIELTETVNKSMPVIIAVSWEKQNELIRKVQSLGIYRFCIYPFCY